MDGIDSHVRQRHCDWFFIILAPDRNYSRVLGAVNVLEGQTIFFSEYVHPYFDNPTSIDDRNDLFQTTIVVEIAINVLHNILHAMKKSNNKRHDGQLYRFVLNKLNIGFNN